MTRFLFSAVLSLMLAGVSAADARVALSEDATIENGLVTVAIGNMLRKGCDDISPRLLRAYSFAQALEARARALGYSRAEIDAYLDSDADKARVKSKAWRYFEARGARASDPASICPIGHREIEKETAIGRLLKQD